MTRPEERPERISTTLTAALEAEHVEVVDDSALHVGHLGAHGGAGHFRVVVVSRHFEGLSRVAAQRLVYAALGDLMTTDIHALEMRTFTPQQWAAAQG
ncbi:MAG: BolA family protein [Thermoanaerobaculales bacterium]|nr:BolA family protein [Thermoanaerobaculales bacterium]